MSGVLTPSCSCRPLGIHQSRQRVLGRLSFQPLRCRIIHHSVPFRRITDPDHIDQCRNRPDSAATGARANSSSHRCTPKFLQGVSVLLASSFIVNAVATPLVIPVAAAAAPSPESADRISAEHSIQPLYAAADAPSVRSDVELTEQQQWWQKDQQVWLELTSADELTAYLSSTQPPPSWPALDSTALNPKLHLVEFYATWCPACKAAAPGMAEVAGDPSLRQHCSFARVNIDRVKPLVRQLGIKQIPTVLLLGPDGTTLDSFRASGQAARDALQQQLAALQQQQPLAAPSLPPGATEGGQATEGQPPASGVDDNGGSSSTGSGSSNGAGDAEASVQGAHSSSGGSDSTKSSPSAAACGVVPEPSCGELPPGVVIPSTATVDGSASNSASNINSTSASASSPSIQAVNSSPAAQRLSSPQATGPADAALQAAKQQFLQQYGPVYGYGGWLDQHYQQEIGDRLGPGKHYLDYTGAALYPASLLEAVYKDLMSHTYGNPHSAAAASVAPGSTGIGSSTGPSGDAVAAAPPAAASEAVMEAAAAVVLDHLHADPADYQVVFTRSATEALRMVGEMFPWNSGNSSTGDHYMQHNVPSELDMLSTRSTRADSMQQQQQQQGYDEVTAAAQPPPSDGSSNQGSSSHIRHRSKFIYTRSNHNSVLGIGAYAAAAGADLAPQSDQGMEAWVASLGQQQQHQQSPLSVGSAVQAPTYNLLAYPAEDNFAGVIYPLDWINKVHAASSPQERTLVLLDAAAYLPTHELNLSQHPADFVVASFYKMFGYPTGLGVLVLRTEHVPALNKVYFGGGSVALATPEGCWHVGKCDPAAALSDGTPNFLGAAALNLAYEAWDSRGGMQAVDQHTQALSSWLSQQLSSLHHSNGAPLLQMYSSHNHQHHPGFSQGAVFNFQVLQPDGQPISFSRVDREATAAGLYLRSGCVCNPGACYDALGLEASEVQALAGLKEGCGDEMDFATVLRPAPQTDQVAVGRTGKSSWWLWGGPGSQQQQQGEEGDFKAQGSADGVLVPTQVPLGSVRVSLGWASTFEDAYALVQFLRGYLS